MRSKKIKIGVLSCLIPFFLYSCEVERIEPVKEIADLEEQEPEVPETDIDENNDDNKNEDDRDKGSGNDAATTEVIGVGSGNLIIKNMRDKKFSIKAGTYSSIRIENITNTLIDGRNQVKVTKGNIVLSESDGLTLSGVSVENTEQAAIAIHKSAKNLTIQNISLKNVSNYGIRFDINKKYDGTPQSFSENIHLKNIKADNIGLLFVSQGSIKNDGFYGLIKGFKLTNSTVRNSPRLNGLTSLGLAENYEISNNTVDNVNASSKYPDGMNTHTAIFYANGNGKIFNNKITNYQGSVVRAWLFSITMPGTVEIFDNIAYNSTRYGAFEIQVPSSIKNLNTFKPADAKIYNNTVGLLNTGEPKFFEGRLLDLYQTYGNVAIYNNLSFQLRDDILINNMSKPRDTKITKNSNNKYFKKASDAVIDLTNFKSKTFGVGARR